MADILIYRMKMPENEPLRIVLNPNGQLFVDHGVTFTEYEAVELPGHGDLIDRDANAEVIFKVMKASEGIERHMAEATLKVLSAAPVIVPSNKEEIE